jgi:hypothetical protein
MQTAELGVRWTIGDVDAHGFQALQLSLWGAHRLFGDRARYVVCVNTVGAAPARDRTGPLPCPVEFRAVDRSQLPRVLSSRLDAGLAEGVAWKFAPLCAFDGLAELALDNDCILWSVPPAVEAWLADTEPSAVVAADVRACFGQFADLAGDAPRNTGIRGLPRGFDLAGALDDVLALRPGVLKSELDEQGLQIAAVTRALPTRVVDVEDVSICSPFWPHCPTLGRSGAHFVGINSRQLPWSYEGRPAAELTREHFARRRDEVAAHVGLPRALASW